MNSKQSPAPNLIIKIIKAISDGSFWHRLKKILNRRIARSKSRQISGSGSDLLIIAPGEMQIPNSGWGAVEYLIQKQIAEFDKKAIFYTLLNSWDFRDWVRCFAKKPRYILLHYDLFSRRCFFFKKLFSPKSRVLVVSHYGYAAFRDNYDSNYPRILKWNSRLDAIIALSKPIVDEFQLQENHAPIFLVPNGVDASDYQIRKKDREVIYLGKIEPRKKQIDVAKILSSNVNIEFVGPVVDLRFEELDDVAKSKFKGPWSRGEVLEKLSRYKVLVLFSDGEADALVLHEAQAAGCSIVVSPQALGSQDKNLPWIYVEENLSNLEAIIEKALNENILYSERIRIHAEQNLTWEKNVSLIMEIFESVK